MKVVELVEKPPKLALEVNRSTGNPLNPLGVWQGVIFMPVLGLHRPTRVNPPGPLVVAMDWPSSLQIWGGRR